MFDKSVMIYQDGESSIKLRAPSYVTQLDYVPTYASQSECLLALAEYTNLSIWDHREKDNNCVKRLSVSSSPLYGLSSDGSNLIGAVGASRTLYLYDIRKWSLFATWANCCKYEVSFYLSLFRIIAYSFSFLSFYLI